MREAQSFWPLAEPVIHKKEKNNVTWGTGSLLLCMEMTTFAAENKTCDI